MARIEIGTIDDPEATIYIDGSDELVFEDDSETDRFAVSQGGPVKIENSNLRLATGQAIEDGSGTNRFELNSTETIIRDNSGEQAINITDTSSEYQLRAYSGKPWVIADREGGFNAVTYSTSSSSPGRLNLGGAGLNADSPAFANSIGVTDGAILIGGSSSGNASSSHSLQFTNANNEEAAIRLLSGNLEATDDGGNTTTII